jgi:acetyl esterase/lipase
MHRNTDIVSVRRTLESGRLPAAQGVTYTPARLGGVAGEWVAATDRTAAPVLLYLHGGGYFACSPRTHRPITAAFAKRGFSVFVPDYRLAPEHAFPAAIEDAQAVWTALLAEHAPAALSIAGDSAGGGLALALLLALRDKNAALPAAACLFSPWTDLAGTGASITTNAGRDAMFWAPGLGSAAKLYLGDTPATTPLASPLYADLTGLPPLLIHVGEREILRDDSLRLAERARAAGVTIDLRVWPVVPHVWQLAQFVPEARQSLDLAAAFLRQPATAVRPLAA